MNTLWNRAKEGLWNLTPALVILTVLVLKFGPSNIVRWIDDRLHAAQRAGREAAPERKDVDR